MRLHDGILYLEKLEIDADNSEGKSFIVVWCDGVAKLSYLPEHGETKVVTHQGKVKRVKFDEGGRVLNWIYFSIIVIVLFCIPLYKFRKSIQNWLGKDAIQANMDSKFELKIDVNKSDLLAEIRAICLSLNEFENSSVVQIIEILKKEEKTEGDILTFGRFMCMLKAINKHSHMQNTVGLYISIYLGVTIPSFLSLYDEKIAFFAIIVGLLIILIKLFYPSMKEYETDVRKIEYVINLIELYKIDSSHENVEIQKEMRVENEGGNLSV